MADDIDQNQIFRICFSKILSQSCILAGCSGKEYRLSVFEVLFYLTVGKSHTALNVFGAPESCQFFHGDDPAVLDLKRIIQRHTIDHAILLEDRFCKQGKDGSRRADSPDFVLSISCPAIRLFPVWPVDLQYRTGFYTFSALDTGV